MTDSANAEHLKTCEATGTDPFALREQDSLVYVVWEREKDKTLNRCQSSAWCRKTPCPDLQQIHSRFVVVVTVVGLM